MKYKLLKDLPTIKAGTIFQEITREVDGSKILKEYNSNNKNTMLVSEINNFDEWFEEITDSIHWKPNNGDEYWYIDDCAGIYRDRWDDESIHFSRYSLGLIKRTKEECEKARDRKLAEVRLQRTSTFKPDFENGNGGWVVFYSYVDKELHSMRDSCTDSGELVRYATEEEAKRSIRENRGEWLKYFGIEEEE